MTDTVEIGELKLEPRLSKGDLVPDGWWQAPEAERKSFARRHRLFLLMVAVPCLLATIYYALVAADQYTSETKFIVRASAQNGIGNLASLMAGQKLSRATDETYAVGEYLLSRDAMQSLVQTDHLRDMFSRPVADFVTRYPNYFSRTNDEALYRHYLHFVSVSNDPESGISTLRTVGFTPQDAHTLAQSLIAKGEALVNRLNARAYQDALRFASQVVDEQKARLLTAEQGLTKFRNDEKLVDPTKELTATFTALGRMTGELMEMQADYALKVAITASAPALNPLRQRIIAYQNEITKQRLTLAGNSASMATKLAAYEELVLSREIAAKGLEVALVHLNAARQDAEQQQLYLETIVEPNTPDWPQYPRRVLMTIAVFAGCFCLFLVARALIGNALEHQP